MKTWNLTQTKQCRHCPWRKDSDLSKIPGYDRQQHHNLAQTIEDDGILDPDRSVRVMACHNSSDGNDFECIGWLRNQLNSNNIGLRMLMIGCANSGKIEVVGEQYSTFEETL